MTQHFSLREHFGSSAFLPCIQQTSVLVTFLIPLTKCPKGRRTQEWFSLLTVWQSTVQHGREFTIEWTAVDGCGLISRQNRRKGLQARCLQPYICDLGPISTEIHTLPEQYYLLWAKFSNIQTTTASFTHLKVWFWRASRQAVIGF